MSLERELDLDTSFADVRHEATLNVIRTANVLAMIGADLFRKFGLTEAQFNVLLVLKFKRHDLTQSDLGKRLVVTRASITSVLDKLEAKRLVARKSVPGNRRIHHVELTPDGRKLIERLEPLYRNTVHGVTAALSEKECKALITLLERIRLQARETEP